MTFRQVKALMEVIGHASLVEFYNQILSYRTSRAEKIPSLEEFLNLTSGNKEQEAKGFDEKTDKFLEEQALKRLTERRKPHGQ